MAKKLETAIVEQSAETAAKPSGGSVRLRLNHSCSYPGAEGENGQTITVDQKTANVIVERGGGEIVND